MTLIADGGRTKLNTDVDVTCFFLNIYYDEQKYVYMLLCYTYCNMIF